jgi:hypothetical protein
MIYPFVMVEPPARNTLDKKAGRFAFARYYNISNRAGVKEHGA